MERLERAAAVEFGGAASLDRVHADRGAGARGAPCGTRSRWRSGSARRSAGAEGDPVAALIAEIGASRLITGKIADVERRTTSGFVRGSVIIEGLGADAGRLVRLELQNENLVALERGRVLASVPDLITVLDTETADAIATERIAYGQRVTVIALRLRPGLADRARASTLAGPRAFGYDFDYVPVEELAGARA